MKRSLPVKVKKVKSKKKKLKKITPSIVIELIHHSTVSKIIVTLTRFGFRSLKSVRIKKINWDLSLEDYYLQGIVHGVSACLPQSKAIQINHNYQECNHFAINIHVSIWRLIFAITLLILCFPYLKTFRLYKSTLALR